MYFDYLVRKGKFIFRGRTARRKFHITPPLSHFHDLSLLQKVLHWENFFRSVFQLLPSPGCFVFILAANIEESTTRWRDTVKRRNRWRYFLWWEFPLVLARRIELVEKKISPYILVWGEENSSKLRERWEENERKKYDRHSGDQSQCRHFVQVNDETDFSFRDSFFWIFLSETGKGRGGNWRLPMYIYLYFLKRTLLMPVHMLTSISSVHTYIRRRLRWILRHSIGKQSSTCSGVENSLLSLVIIENKKSGNIRLRTSVTAENSSNRCHTKDIFESMNIFFWNDVIQMDVGIYLQILMLEYDDSSSTE